MDLFVLSSVVDGQVSSLCSFEVIIDAGVPIAADTSVPSVGTVIVPDGAQQIEIHANPTTDQLWPLVGTFKRQDDGSFVALPSTPAEFAAPLRVSNAGQSLVSITAYLSRLRDATAPSLNSLGNVPPIRQNHVPQAWPPAAGGQPAGSWPATVWNTPPLDDHQYVADPPIVNDALVTSARSVDPSTTDLVVEFKGVNAPQTIAISWPDAVARTEEAGATPFLVYFHSGMGQIAGAYYTHPQVGTYPFGFDYIYYGLWRYMNYTSDPLTRDPYSKGLPYQMAASGKSAVVVMPGSKVGPEVGVFLSAASMETVLREIQAFMFRRAGIYTPPALGRTALASFSSGNNWVTAFLAKRQNQESAFYQQTLRELYMFDAPGYGSAAWVAQAIAWANRGDVAKMIRAYTSHGVSSYAKLLGHTPPQKVPFVESSDDGNRTAAVLPIAAWRNAIIASGGLPTSFDTDQFGSTHQLVSAIMLTDALRRSGF